MQKSSLVYPAVVYIEEHLHEMIPMHEMASLCHLSRSYFSRLFQHDTGENYTDYVNRRKVERAKELLRDTPDSVSAIAAALGFMDVSYFVNLQVHIQHISHNCTIKSSGNVRTVNNDNQQIDG